MGGRLSLSWLVAGTLRYDDDDEEEDEDEDEREEEALKIELRTGGWPMGEGEGPGLGIPAEGPCPTAAVRAAVTAASERWRASTTETMGNGYK